MLKKIIYILVLTFFNCKNIKKGSLVTENLTAKELQKSFKKEVKKETVDRDKYLVTDCDTISLEHLSLRKENKTCVVLKRKSFVYCSPFLKSTIIDTLKFNTEFKSNQNIVNFLYNEKGSFKGERSFLKIDIDNKQGYILEEDLALKKIENNILLGKKSYNEYKILSIDKEENIIDSLFFDGHGSESDINFSKKKVLPFDERLICVGTNRTSCPGASSINYVSIDKRGKMKMVISSSDDTGGSSYVCFPTGVENGVVKYSIIGTEVNSEDVLPVDYEYLKSLGIPLNRLIIESETIYKGDIEGLEEEEIKIASYLVNIYKWEDDSLQKVKTLESKETKVLRNNKTNYPTSGKAYVIAKNGLTYRETPNIKGVKINKFDFGTEVVVLENSDVEFEIVDEGKKLKGTWVKVKAKRNNTHKIYDFGRDYKFSGYVFNGFLVDSIHAKFKRK